MKKLIVSGIEDNSQVKSMETQYDNLLNRIQQLNKQLDNKSISDSQKDSIYDQLGRLKDQRKELSLKISDLKIKLGNKEMSGTRELASDWFKDLPEEERKQYLEDHPNSKYAQAKGVAKPPSGTYRSPKDNSEKTRINDSKEIKKLRNSLRVYKEKLNVINYNLDNLNDRHDKSDLRSLYKDKNRLKSKITELKDNINSMKQTSSFKVIASEWFEALSEKQQKEYLELHPDSKFAHKLGKGSSNKDVVKDNKKIKEHLEGEGVDLSKDYFNQPGSHAELMYNMHKMAGKSESKSGKSRGRALLDNLSKTK